MRDETSVVTTSEVSALVFSPSPSDDDVNSDDSVQVSSFGRHSERMGRVYEKEAGGGGAILRSDDR